MQDFVLIDLYSQRQAVLAYVRNLSPNEIMVWIEQYGEIQKAWTDRMTIANIVTEEKGTRYIFFPHVCRYLPSIFLIDEANLLFDIPPQYYR